MRISLCFGDEPDSLLSCSAKTSQRQRLGQSLETMRVQIPVWPKSEIMLCRFRSASYSAAFEQSNFHNQYFPAGWGKNTQIIVDFTALHQFCWGFPHVRGQLLFCTLRVLTSKACSCKISVESRSVACKSLHVPTPAVRLDGSCYVQKRWAALTSLAILLDPRINCLYLVLGVHLVNEETVLRQSL